MQKEEYLPFWANLSYLRLKFESKSDLITHVASLGDCKYLLVDRIKNFHIVRHDPKKERIPYQVPPYATSLNPNTLYSVDYVDLYKYIYKRKITMKSMRDYIYHIDQPDEKYIFYVYLGNHKLAIQMNRFDPLAIIDLHNLSAEPQIFHDIFETKRFIQVGNNNFVWYETKTKTVHLYSYLLHKRKILNFKKDKVRALRSLNEKVVIAQYASSIEILNYATNTIIKSVILVTPKQELYLAVYPPHNIITYVYMGYIHVYKISQGAISSENYFDLKEHKEWFKSYSFVGHDHIVACMKGNIFMFKLTSYDLFFINLIERPYLEVREPSGLNIYCCEKTEKKGIITWIEGLSPGPGDSEFAIVESFCSEKSNLHGMQRVILFSCDFKKEKPNETLIAGSLDEDESFSFLSSSLFREYRDPVTIIDVFEEKFAVFITERGRIFKLCLKRFIITYIIEIGGVFLKQTYDMKHLDKFYALDNDHVLITTKTGESPFIHFFLLSLSQKSIIMDSKTFFSSRSDLNKEYLFYNVIKINKGRLIFSYTIRSLYDLTDHLGELTIERNSHKDKPIGNFKNVLKTGVGVYPIFDNLWYLNGSYMVARHKENFFKLSILDCSSYKLESEFSVEKYNSISNVQLFGIIDVQPFNENVINVHVKMNSRDFKMLVYNWKTQELINQISTTTSFIGLSKLTFVKEDKIMNMKEVGLFGYYGLDSSGLTLVPMSSLLEESKMFKIDVEGHQLGLCISPRNFKALSTKSISITYDTDHNKNYICVLRPVNFKLECLRITKKGTKDIYHSYIYKDIIQTMIQ